MHDTIAAKIIWIKNLNECLLIGTESLCNKNDTIVIISPNDRNIKAKKVNRIEIGQPYFLIIEKDIITGSPLKKMSVSFKHTVVWTNKESYKLKPRLCVNCIGQYIK